MKLICLRNGDHQITIVAAKTKMIEIDRRAHRGCIIHLIQVEYLTSCEDGRTIGTQLDQIIGQAIIIHGVYADILPIRFEFQSGLIIQTQTPQLGPADHARVIVERPGAREINPLRDSENFPHPIFSFGAFGFGIETQIINQWRCERLAAHQNIPGALAVISCGVFAGRPVEGGIGRALIPDSSISFANPELRRGLVSRCR